MAYHPTGFSNSSMNVTNSTNDGVDKNPDGLPVSFTPRTLYILECVSLSLAVVSVVAALIAFYWFVRMRRTFRQDLIMLLIQSDMLKAFWLMTCPIVYFTRGPLETSDAFCQVSAFFLTSAIEASDIAVLMIAVHSALYIFRPQRSGGETGLYPYRRYAYAIWFVVPLVLAAIVPITGQQFVNTGPHCYLPMQPLWYRTAVSWIPRYAIFGIIICVYLWIYIYTGCRFRRLQRDQRRASTSTNSAGSSGKNPARKPFDGGVVPPTPVLLHHGLLQSPQCPMNGQAPGRNRQASVSSTVSTLKLDDRTTTPTDPQKTHQGEQPVVWNWQDTGFATNTPLATPRPSGPRPDAPTLDAASPTTISFALETPGVAPPGQGPAQHDGPKDPELEPTRSHTNWQRPLAGGRNRLASTAHNLTTALRATPARPAAPERNPSSSSIHLMQPLADDALYQSRRKMRKQLRLLFVYPLMYIITWIAPFVSHCWRYKDADDQSQPIGLIITGVASLCIGAAVDCCFFSAWEKPWQHFQGGFWHELRLRLHIFSHGKTMGRTREERLRDATAAMDRRQHETAERVAAAQQGNIRPARTAPRQWWDALTEEGSE